MRKIIGCCLIAVSLLACTACSGLDRLSENLREGAEQLGDDVVIGKSNALIAPYQSFEGSRTSDNDAFLATYDASVPLPIFVSYHSIVYPTVIWIAPE